MNDRIKIILLSLLAFALSLPALALPDETLILYPTDAALVNGVWEVPVHGWVFEPEEDSVKRGLLLDLAKNIFDRELGPEEEALFRKRAIRFLADSEEGKDISLKLCNRESKAVTSSEGGQVNLTLSFPDNGVCEGKNGWVEVSTVPEEGDGRVFTGLCRFLEPEGISVISDIDDTIKLTRVTDRAALLENTFLRPFLPVDGMAALYRKWESEGAKFHYLSASPWQLYEPLSEFLKKEGFPQGSFYLKSFRLTPSGIGEITNHSRDYKISRLTALLERYPKRKFILVGDSGEADPEIYGDIARKFPSQVVKILIRDTGGPETGESGRYRAAFERIEESRCKVFGFPGELSDIGLTAPKTAGNKKTDLEGQ